MRGWRVALTAVVAGIPMAMASPAIAADGGLSIDYVEPTADGVQILVSVPEGAGVAPEDLAVAIDDQEVETTGERAADSVQTVRRTTVIAMDTSDSMARQGRFEAAKDAATTFLENVPDDVYVGIVTFDSDVETVYAPSLDREAGIEVLQDLELARETRLNDAILEAIDIAGDEGQRSLLVLSDGKDTSDTPDEDVTAAIIDAEVKVDVVALDQAGDDLAPLEAVATASGGSVISSDADALAGTFADEAEALARQILLTAPLPEGLEEVEADVAVTAASAGMFASTYTIVQEAQEPGADLTVAPTSDAIEIPKEAMYGGIAALGLGMLILFSALVNGVGRPATVEARIAAYTGGGGHGPAPQDSALNLDQAKDAAASVLSRNKGLESRIENRLEAAGSALKPSEWILIHGAVILLSGLVGMLLFGRLPLAFLFMVGGFVLPWFWLGRKRKKRIKAFNAALADTLQLMAGSLSAGMSLAQSVDTVVREGNEPVSGEFKRVLIESRLGVAIEDALEGIATRIQSKDFAWVVMAIRIQREVGGNLAELLTTVAATLRERDYLRRQVHSLSAEGRLSAYILGGLPVFVLMYLIFFRWAYVEPLFTTLIGLILLVIGVVLLAIASFLMSRIVKVEV